MSDGISRVTLLSPAGHPVQVAEDQVDKFLDAGWTKSGGRRASHSNPPTGPTPTQQSAR